MLYFLYFLVVSSYVYTKGYFSLGSFFSVFIFFIVFLLYILKKVPIVQTVFSSRFLLLYLSLISVLFYGGIFQDNIVLVFLSYILLGVNLLIMIRFVLFKNTYLNKNLYLLSFSLLIIVRLFMIWSSPEPKIDVFDYLKLGAQGFLSGKNPYDMHYTKLYKNLTPDYYGYLPGMLFYTLPFVFVLKDPRYAFLTAEIICSLVILKFVIKNNKKYIYSLLFLLNPMSNFITEQSYTEPFILLLFLLAGYYISKKKYYLLAVILGYAVAVKQYVFLSLPVVIKYFADYTKRTKVITYMLLSAVISALFILPFFFWNRSEFLKDAIFLQYVFKPRYEGLSFFSFTNLFSLSYNSKLSFFLITIFFVLPFRWKKMKLSNYFTFLSFQFFVFFFFNKWMFLNYYYLVSQLLLAGAVLGENKQ